MMKCFIKSALYVLVKKINFIFFYFRFFNFSSSDSSQSDKNRNDPDDDVIKKQSRIISAGTIAEALKQLQLIEEREEREKRSTSKSIENSPTKMIETPTRLLRYVDGDADSVANVENNENRRKLSLSKNVRRLTLTTTLNVASNNAAESQIENDVFESNVDNQTTETSATLVEIRREKESLVSDILQTICDLRDLQLVAMSYRVRQRAVASKYPTYVMKDFPSLYGRCFNLSMNLKILTQCQFGDAAIAARVLSDFDILEKSLEAKLPPPSDISSMLQQIKI
jgi:hypothetical protein